MKLTGEGVEWGGVFLCLENVNHVNVNDGINVLL